MMKHTIINIKSIAFLAFFTAMSYQAAAQSTTLKVGTNPTVKDPSAVLELEATNKGALLPRVALTSTTDATTVPTPANALTVFNTATAGDVTPGYYYWSAVQTKWIKLATDAWDLKGNKGTTRGTNFIGTKDDNDLMVKTNGKYRMHFNNNGGLVIGDSALVYNRTLANGFSGIRSEFYNDDPGNTTTPYPAFGMVDNLYVRFKPASPALAGSFRALSAGLKLSADAGTNKSSGDISGAAVYAQREPITGNTDGGTIASISGLRVYAGNSTGAAGTTSKFYGVNVEPYNQGTGTITDFYGYYMSQIAGGGVGTGTITNKYGVYIDNLFTNYFKGSVGIGTAAGVATNQLHVKATTNPVRFEGLQTGAATDNIVVADATGVLKTVAASTMANDWHLTGNAGTNPAGGTSSGTDFLGTTDATDFQIKVGTNSSYNSIMRVSNAKGHTQFGNWLDTSSSPNIQNADRFMLGSSVNTYPSNFTVANNFAAGDISRTLPTSNFRTAAYFNASGSTPIFSNYMFSQFNTGYTGPISNNTNQLSLIGGAIYAPVGAGQIVGSQSIVSLAGSSTVTTSGGTIGVLGTISSGTGSTFNGPVFAILGRTSTAGTYNGAVAGVRGSLEGTGTYNGAVMGAQGSVSSGTFNGQVIGTSGSVTGTGTFSGTSNVYGLHSNINTTGSPASGYGLYIEDINGPTAQWGAYQVGANDNNYFAGNTGIGTTAGAAPTNKLHVVATANPVRFEGLQTGLATDNIVVADATGVLKTVAASTMANDWHITGNTGTTPGVNGISGAADGNYIGTADAQNLVVATGGIKRLIIDNNANFYGGNGATTGVAFTTNNGGNNRNFIWGNNNRLLDPGLLGNANANAIFGANNVVNAGGSSFGSTNIVSGGGNTLSTSSSGVFGNQNNVSGGLYNFVGGFQNVINGGGSVVVYGSNNTVAGGYSLTSGRELRTASAYELTTGLFNAITAGTNVNSATNWFAADPLLQVGMGTSDAARANALTILKNGNIGTDIAIAPTERVDIGSGNLRVRAINANRGTATDNIVVADANGVLKTVAPSTSAAIRTEAGDYAALATDETILADANTGAITITLPAAPTTGKRYNVKKIDNTANPVTVDGNGNNIDGNTTVAGTSPFQGWVMQFDGDNWFIISRI